MPDQTASRTSVLLFLLALFVNMRNVFGVFTKFGIFPRGTDSYYQMLRIQYLLEQSWRIPNIDYTINFPTGSLIYWPFGFTYCYAILVKILSFGQADQWWGVAISSMLTPILASLVPCLAYLIGVQMGQKRIGLWAGLLLAVLPVEFYTVGYIDHQVFEAFWPAVYLLAYLRGTRFSAAIAGVAITAGILFTNALPIMIPLHAFVVCLHLARVWRDEQQRQHVFTLNVFLFAGLLVSLLPFAATRIAEPNGINPALAFSWVAAFILFAALLALTRGPRPMVIGAMIVAPLVLLTLDWPALINFFIYGLNDFIFKADPFVAQIVEARPMFSFDFRTVLATYSGFLFLWPVAIAWMLWYGWRNSTSIWIVALISLATAVPAISHFRFFTLFLLPYAITIGFLMHEVFVRIQANRTRTAAFISLTILAILPAVMSISFRPTIAMSTDNRFVDLYSTFQWIGEHTPPTSSSGKADTDYAIATQWAVGNWILYYAKRPIIASPSAHLKDAREGVQAGSAILMFPPDRAAQLIKERKARYVLVSPINMVGTLRLAYGQQPDDPGAAINESLFVHLLNSGVPGGGKYAPVLRRFRLVHESEPGLKYLSYNHPYATLFEFVPGAEIFGTARPNSLVTIKARIKTPAGREIQYADSVTAGGDGKFSCVVPYAAGNQRYSDVGLSGPYAIGNEGRTAEVSFTEEEILSGKRQEIVWP